MKRNTETLLFSLSGVDVQAELCVYWGKDGLERTLNKRMGQPPWLAGCDTETGEISLSHSEGALAEDRDPLWA